MGALISHCRRHVPPPRSRQVRGAKASCRPTPKEAAKRSAVKRTESMRYWQNGLAPKASSTPWMYSSVKLGISWTLALCITPKRMASSSIRAVSPLRSTA